MDLVKDKIALRFKESATIKMAPLRLVEEAREAVIGRKLKSVRIDLNQPLAEELERIDRALENLQKNI
jgi:hypothetical protein